MQSLHRLAIRTSNVHELATTTSLLRLVIPPMQLPLTDKLYTPTLKSSHDAQGLCKIENS